MLATGSRTSALISAGVADLSFLRASASAASARTATFVDARSRIRFPLDCADEAEMQIARTNPMTATESHLTFVGSESLLDASDRSDASYGSVKWITLHSSRFMQHASLRHMHIFI